MKHARPSNPVLCGIDLYAEMAKYLALPVFHRHTSRRPKPRLAIWTWKPRPGGRTKPRKFGHAFIDGSEIMLVDWPGLTAHDLKETLLHECVHAHGVRGHGAQFKILLRQAAKEAFGVTPHLKNRFHGHIAPLLKAAADLAADLAGPYMPALVPVVEQVPQAPAQRPARANVGPRLTKEARQARALEAAHLRRQGFTYAYIAEKLGLPNSGVAHRVVREGQAR